MARLEYILKGIRREGACSAAHLRKERQPITPALLKRLFKVWEGRPNLRNSKMLWAASCLAFFAFLRVGEFTSPLIRKFDDKLHLSVSDVSVNHHLSPSVVFILLKHSKIDQILERNRKNKPVSTMPSNLLTELSGGEGNGSWSSIYLG